MRVALVGPVQLEPLLPWLDGHSTRGVPAGRGGTPVTQLARGLLGRGHHVTVVSLEAVEEEVRVAGPLLTVCFGQRRARHRARDAFRAERRYLSQALRREAPDVVHAHWTYEYALGALNSGIPTVVTVRDWAPTILRHSPTPYRMVRLMMNIQALARARHLTVASPYMRDRLMRWKSSDIPIIPNALDDELFNQKKDELNSESPLIVAINRGFAGRKNVPALLAAFEMVHRRKPACRLRLIGRDYDVGGVAYDWAEARGLTESIEFCGRVNHSSLPGMLREADLFVHPALEESFGMVLVEAMAQGVPVIAGARSGAVPWVLDEGRAGVLVDVSSPEAIARAIDEVLGNPARWRHYADAGFWHATERFRLSRVLDDYLEVYAQAIGNAAA